MDWKEIYMDTKKEMGIILNDAVDFVGKLNIPEQKDQLIWEAKIPHDCMNIPQEEKEEKIIAIYLI